MSFTVLWCITAALCAISAIVLCWDNGDWKEAFGPAMVIVCIFLVLYTLGSGVYTLSNQPPPGCTAEQTK